MGTVLYYRVWAGDCSIIQGMDWGLFFHTGRAGDCSLIQDMGWGLFCITGYGLGTVL